MAQHVVEHTRSETAVLVEHLVDDVPGVHLALVARQERRDVVLHHGGECCFVADGRDPGRELAVPDGGVAADQLLVSRGEVDGLVCGAEVEVVARGLGGVPFHAAAHMLASIHYIQTLMLDKAMHVTGLLWEKHVPVLGRHLSKVRLDDCTSAPRVEAAWVGRCTEVLLALANYGIVDALGCLTGEERLSVCNWSGCSETTGKQDDGEDKLHDLGDWTGEGFECRKSFRRRLQALLLESCHLFILIHSP